MKLKVHILFFNLILLSGLSAQDPNFHIYLCFGQSNMEGQGVIENQDLDVDDRFQVFQALDCPNLGRVKETWYTAVPPNCQCWSRLSPADYFGRTMVENLQDSITIGIINVAVGGCDIRLFDKDIYQDYDSTYVESWFLDKVAAYEGSPYHYLINLAQLAQQDGVIKGILLHQGETNTGNTDWPNYVQKIYNDMLNDLSLEATDVPLLAGEVMSAPGNCCASMNTIINQLPDVVPTAHVISSSGCTASDNAHFDSAGYRLLGTRYAEKMLTLVESTILGTPEVHSSGFSHLKVHPNPNTDNILNINFSIPEKAFIALKLLSPSGVELAEIAEEEFSSGEHILKYNIPDLPAGIYFVKAELNGFIKSKAFVIKN